MNKLIMLAVQFLYGLRNVDGVKHINNTLYVETVKPNTWLPLKVNGYTVVSVNFRECDI
jgi:hypothetical protein